MAFGKDWMPDLICKKCGKTGSSGGKVFTVDLQTNEVICGACQPPVDDLVDLAFGDLRRVNVTRCERWHSEDSSPWSLADWSNALCGEAGELANFVKKIRRHETGARNDGDPSVEELRAKARLELADVVTHADLLAIKLGVDLAEAIREKFNKVSEKFGFRRGFDMASETEDAVARAAYREIMMRLGLACLLTLLFFLGLGLGLYIGNSNMKQAAVKAGKAEWYATSEGDLEWRWKP